MTVEKKLYTFYFAIIALVILIAGSDKHRMLLYCIETGDMADMSEMSQRNIRKVERKHAREYGSD